jgi:hypothetical protein
MIVHWLKDRFGFVLVVAVAALGTGLVSGHYFVAVGTGLLIGLVLVAFWRSPSQRTLASDSPTEQGGPGDRFGWSFPAANNRSRSDLIQVLQGLGFRLDIDDGRNARFDGGSLLRTRLFGGYFVNPSQLPIAVTVGEPNQPDGPAFIEVRDRMGRIAVRDRALKSRYSLRVKEIQEALYRV